MKTHLKGPLIAVALTVVVAAVVAPPIRALKDAQDLFVSKPVFTDPIVGTWNCHIPPAGGAPAFTVLKSIHVGGTESEIDNAAPPSQESPTVGTWSSTGGGLYMQNANQMVWDATGNFVGTFYYSGPMSLSPSLNQLDIVGTATLIDGNANVLTSFSFTASCTRQ